MAGPAVSAAERPRLTLHAATLTPAAFAAKWQGVVTSERASAQSHFLDVCRMVGVDSPSDADPAGEWYAFEKGIEKMGGGDGWADVWLRDHFAWEYKGKKHNLKGAYLQLQTYRESLENPPLMVVCDLDRFEIHTNFTAMAKHLYAFDLAEIAAEPERCLGLLRDLFTNPEALRPPMTPEEVTEAAAKLFGLLAQQVSARGHEPRRVAHFLDKLLFCLES